MPTPDTPCHDVIIAGAGPVGLFLACELRLAGASVLVLEKAEEPNSPLKGLPFGLRGLTVSTVENFDRRDLLDELKARAASRDLPAAAHWMQQQRRPAGHFAGIQFFHDQVDTAAWRYRLAGPIGSTATDMASIESVLAIRAEALGVDIRRGCGVTAFDQSDEGIVVRAGDEMFVGRWLVGCDGGRSIVRKAAGIGFVGTEPEFTGYSAQVVLADPTSIKPGRHYTPAGMYTFAAPGTLAMVDFDGGACHRTEPTRGHVEAVLRRVSGIDVTVATLELATTWTDRAYQATEYRSGRVLLAGDAAHIHSPLGGQGLNLGLGDAINLGWKLGAVIRGDVSDALLDTYALERHAVGAQILDWSRAQVALMRPSPASRAMEAIVRDLIETRDGATYFAERVWGVGLRYDLGGDHALVGRSVPDFNLADGSRVNEHLRTGRGLLIDFSGRASLGALADRWVDRMDHVAGNPAESMAVSAAIVRPDGIVAWVSSGTPDSEEIMGVAIRWFGLPQTAVPPKLMGLHPDRTDIIPRQ